LVILPIWATVELTFPSSVRPMARSRARILERLGGASDGAAFPTSQTGLRSFRTV
jgi:hypothetical protein